MCDPLTAAGIGSTVLGGFIQQRDASKNVKRGVEAANAATRENFAKQDAYAKQSREKFDKTLPTVGADATRQGEAAATAQRSQAAERATAPLTDYAPAASGGNSVVQNEVARKMAEGASAATAAGGRQARLSSFGDAAFGNRLAVGQAASDLGTISNFSRGTAGLLPLQRDAAYQNAQRRPSILGPGLKLIGGGATLAGSFGLSPFGQPDIMSYAGGTGTNPMTGLRYGGV